MSRWGASRHEAQTRLTVALAERTAFPAGDWSRMLTVDAAVVLWRADLESAGLAPATRQLYAAAARLYVQPALGRLRLGELSVAVIDRALAAVLAERGPQRARAARRALSSVCTAAVRHGALGHNPVRDSRPIRCPRRRIRALTGDEAADLQARLRADSTAVRLDLPDLVQFMLGTGVRIGEASAVREAVLDQRAGTVHINALDGLVNNAGIFVNGPIEALAIDDVAHQLDVNVVAQVAVTQAALPRIRAARGRIVFISSTSGLYTTPGTGAYNASKYAIEAVGDALRMELRPWRIAVSLIEPGPISTALWGDVEAAHDRMTAGFTAEHRELYAAHLAGTRRLLRTVATQTDDPMKVAKAVEHALTARRPKRRYLLDLSSRAQKAFTGLAPSALTDAVLAAATTAKVPAP